MPVAKKQRGIAEQAERLPFLAPALVMHLALASLPRSSTE
jgi:hypothetical protein